MKLIQKVLMLAALSATPALLAGEPAPAVSSQTSTNAPASQEDLAEQAALVQQIGEEAARGFDAEAHAHALRLQIEALATLSSNAKSPAPAAPARVVEPRAAAASAPAPASKPAEATAVAVTTAPAVPAQQTVREAIQKMRTALDQLETQLSRTQKER